MTTGFWILSGVVVASIIAKQKFDVELSLLAYGVATAYVLLFI